MMKTQNLFAIALLSLLVISAIIPFAMAQDSEEEDGDPGEGDIKVYGLELEKVILMINGWIATFLFVFAFTAYKRDGRKRLFWVALAFLLFAIKSFLISSVLIFPEVEWFDPLAVFLEFGVILSFFLGVLKK
jgi:hypothetical protein